MMKIAIAAMGVVLLAGCATKQPAIQVRTVEVPVIRVEKCVREADLPVRPGRLATPRPKNASRALDLAVAKVMAWERYGGEASALLKGCAD